MAVMYGSGLPRVRWVLASRVSLRLGLFSYSIYLLHGLSPGLLKHEILSPMRRGSLATFALLLVIEIPVILVILLRLPSDVRGAVLGASRYQRDPCNANLPGDPVAAAEARVRCRVSPAPEVVAPQEAA
jgi:hypothetical protein